MLIPATLQGEMTGLNVAMAKYATALGLEPRQVVRQQAGILARELAEGSAPKSKAALDVSMEKDVRRVYAPAPRQMLPMAHRRGKGFMWLMATPAVVVGVRNHDYHLEDSVSDMTNLFHRTNPRGNKYEQLGTRKETYGNSIMRVVQKRGVQKVMRLNRIVVQRGVFNKFLVSLKKRGGILGGSWVVAWNVLQPKGRKPPAYKFRHVEDGTARGTYIDGLGIPGHPRFSLVNRATGCTNPKQLEMVRGKLRFRAEAMALDMKNMLRGAYRKAGFKNGGQYY